MSPPQFGVTLDLRIDMRAIDAGGRRTPIGDGYRPLCIIDGPDGQITVGLCELRLDDSLSPGESGIGRLSIDVFHTDRIRALLRVGSSFQLAEGDRVVATAWVLEISQ